MHLFKFGQNITIGTEIECRKGYNINVLQQTACLMVNPITVDNFVYLFNCMLTGRTSDSMTVLA